MQNIRHLGLFFTQSNVNNARKNAKRPPFKDALKYLSEHKPLDSIALIQWNGLKWIFQDDNSAAQAGIDLLESIDISSYVENQKTALKTLTDLTVLAHGFELLRNHQALSPADVETWTQTFYQQVIELNERFNDDNYLHQVWLATLNIATGIVVENNELFESGAQRIRDIIDNDVHPSGYIQEVVDKPNGFEDFLYVIQAMVLACAAADTVNVDLWGYNKRGVSTTTICLYPLYYFYYPEKWQWHDKFSIEEIQEVFTHHGGFLEIVNHHNGRSTHAIELIFKEIRPIYDSVGGGLTTLTHGVTQKRLGLFG